MTHTTLRQFTHKLKVFASCLALAACGASSGTLVSADQVAGFRPGRTSYQDVEAKLGAPTTRTTNADGSFAVAYTHAETAARPETYIPIVGPLVGGADSSSHTVEMKFTRAGILAETKTQDSQIGSSVTAR